MTPSRRSTLGRDFFERRVDDVARDLLGTIMVVHHEGGVTRTLIEETEAYGGHDDPASHAFRGPTPRTAFMFGRAGVLYVYRSYGIHWCANVVTQGVGSASAVLLRAGRVDEDATATRPGRSSSAFLRGPGILTRELGIDGDDNGIDCCEGVPVRIRFEPRAATSAPSIEVTRRVGLTRGTERLSRYVMAGTPVVATRVPRTSSQP